MDPHPTCVTPTARYWRAAYRVAAHGDTGAALDALSKWVEVEEDERIAAEERRLDRAFHHSMCLAWAEIAREDRERWDQLLGERGDRFPTGEPVTPQRVKGRPAWLAFLARLVER